MDETAGWAIAVVALAFIWLLRSRSEIASPSTSVLIDQAPPRSKKNIFSVKVVALEFDESGSSLFVNGAFYNDSEAYLEIENVEAKISVGADSFDMIWFDPSGEGQFVNRRIATLVTLSGPVTLNPNEDGLFRVPLFSPELAAKIAALLDEIDIHADKFIDKLDRVYSEYSIDETSIDKLLDEFVKNDKMVSSLARKIDDALILKPGPVLIRVYIFGADEDLVDQFSLEASLDRDEWAKLSHNGKTMIRNALLDRLSLPLSPYNAIVLDEKRLRHVM